ncbi:GTPase HflX, partial [Escherichia coli]|nr:GTPase HflX [Escherichia coli]
MERKPDYEKVILVGCHTDEDDQRFEYSMEELESLTETANGKVLASITQKRERVHPSTYIGKGKVEELAALQEEMEADII